MSPSDPTPFRLLGSAVAIVLVSHLATRAAVGVTRTPAAQSPVVTREFPPGLYAAERPVGAALPGVPPVESHFGMPPQGAYPAGPQHFPFPGGPPPFQMPGGPAPLPFPGPPPVWGVPGPPAAPPRLALAGDRVFVMRGDECLIYRSGGLKLISRQRLELQPVFAPGVPVEPEASAPTPFPAVEEPGLPPTGGNAAPEGAVTLPELPAMGPSLLDQLGPSADALPAPKDSGPQ